MNSPITTAERAHDVSEYDQLRERLNQASIEARFYRGLCWTLMALAAAGTFLSLLYR